MIKSVKKQTAYESMRDPSLVTGCQCLHSRTVCCGVDRRVLHVHEVAASLSDLISIHFVAVLEETVRSKQNLVGLLQQRLALRARAGTRCGSDASSGYKAFTQDLMSDMSKSLSRTAE